MRMDGATATRAAVADGVETTQHGVFEEGVVDVVALVFPKQDILSFLRRDTARTAGVMLDDQAGKWLANDQAHIQRQAGVGAGAAAGAFEGGDVIGVLQDDVAGERVGDDFFQVGQANVFLDGHELAGSFQWNHFAVVRIRPGYLTFGLQLGCIIFPQQVGHFFNPGTKTFC